MKREIKSCLGLLLALVLMNAAAPIADAQESQWKPIKTWTGSGLTTTETFTVATSEWRIRWQTGKADVGSFYVMVKDDKGDLVSASVATDKPGTSGLSYMHHRAGRYHLIIFGTMDWSVTVEEEQSQ